VPELERLDVATVALERPTTAKLVALLRRVRPRIAHVVDVWPQALIASRLARVPRVLVTHHTPELPRHDNLAGRAWLWAGWLTKPEVVYTSASDRDRDGRRPSHVVPLGIDLDRFAVGKPVLPKNGPLVGNVGRLAPQKDHATLLEAIALVRERRPDVRLVLVGDGELRVELERQAAALGLAESVLLLGERHDVPDLLASIDVFANASRYEGLCLAVIEAQAAGVPVVATPVGGIRETIVDGETGLLVPPGDHRALADAISRLLDDRHLATRLASAARLVAERYSERRMIDETLRLYGLAPGV
jgi:glycosyltransferase involved in cell wall biosynthesis